MHEYPKAMIREEGESMIVLDKSEEADARKDGWRFWSDDGKPAKKAGKAE